MCVNGSLTRSFTRDAHRDNLLRKDFSERHTRYYFKVRAHVSFHFLPPSVREEPVKSLSSAGPSRMKGGWMSHAATPSLCVAHANWLLINLSLMGVIIKTRPTRRPRRSKITHNVNAVADGCCCSRQLLREVYACVLWQRHGFEVGVIRAIITRQESSVAASNEPQRCDGFSKST